MEEKTDYMALTEQRYAEMGTKKAEYLKNGFFSILMKDGPNLYKSDSFYAHTLPNMHRDLNEWTYIPYDVLNFHILRHLDFFLDEKKFTFSDIILDRLIDYEKGGEDFDLCSDICEANIELIWQYVPLHIEKDGMWIGPDMKAVIKMMDDYTAWVGESYEGDLGTLKEDNHFRGQGDAWEQGLSGDDDVDYNGGYVDHTMAILEHFLATNKLIDSTDPIWVEDFK